MNNFPDFMTLIVNILTSFIMEGLKWFAKKLIFFIKGKTFRAVNKWLFNCLHKFLKTSFKIEFSPAHFIVGFLILSSVFSLFAGAFIGGVQALLLKAHPGGIFVWFAFILYLAGYSAWLANSFYKDFIKKGSS